MAERLESADGEQDLRFHDRAMYGGIRCDRLRNYACPHRYPADVSPDPLTEHERLKGGPDEKSNELDRSRRHTRPRWLQRLTRELSTASHRQQRHQHGRIRA